jgi:hypothetical protein
LTPFSAIHFDLAIVLARHSRSYGPVWNPVTVFCREHNLLHAPSPLTGIAKESDSITVLCHSQSGRARRWTCHLNAILGRRIHSPKNSPIFLLISCLRTSP